MLKPSISRSRGFKGGRLIWLALGVATVCAALVAPSAASAAGPSIEPVPTAPFTGAGAAAGILEFKSGTKIGCEKYSTIGHWNTKQTGTVQLKLEKCSSGCTTFGSASGTIATQTVEFQLAYLNAAHTRFGWLLRPEWDPAKAALRKVLEEGGISESELEALGFRLPFVKELSCPGGGGYTKTLNGALIAEVLSPGLNKSVSTNTLKFTTGTIEGTGHEYHLESEEPGGVMRERVKLEGQQSVTYSDGAHRYSP